MRTASVHVFLGLALFGVFASIVLAANGFTPPTCTAVNLEVNPDDPRGFPSGEFYGYNWTQTWLDEPCLESDFCNFVPEVVVLAFCVDQFGGPMRCPLDISWSTDLGVLLEDPVPPPQNRYMSRVWQSPNTVGTATISVSIPQCGSDSLQLKNHVINACTISPKDAHLGKGATQSYSFGCLTSEGQAVPCYFSLGIDVESLSSDASEESPSSNSLGSFDKSFVNQQSSTAVFSAANVDGQGFVSADGPTFECSTSVTVGEPVSLEGPGDALEDGGGSSGGSGVPVLVSVKQPPSAEVQEALGSKEPEVFVSQSVSLIVVGGVSRSQISLSVDNPLSVALKDVTLKYPLPKSVAFRGSDPALYPELLFDPRPDRVEEGSAVVVWLFDEVQAGESADVSVTLDRELDADEISLLPAPQVLAQSLKAPERSPSALSQPASDSLPPTGASVPEDAPAADGVATTGPDMPLLVLAGLAVAAFLVGRLLRLSV